VTPTGATAAARRAAARRPARARGRAAPAPAPRVVPRTPRRVSGPARGRPLRRGRATLGARAVAALRAMPDHVIVERLTRGRLWIALIACLLLGLVAMQVALLKLNAGIGRAVQQGANLERRNGELRAEISRMGSEERIQAMGAKLGLIMPDAGHVTYLAARPGQDPPAALQALRANRLGSALPSAQSFASTPAATSAPSTDQSGSGASSTAQAAPSTDQSAGGSQPTTPAASTDQSASGGQSTTGAAGDPSAGSPSAAGAGGTGPQG
jgi:cell division protein FtsL